MPFRFRLARDLGMTVQQMTEQMSDQELAAWKAFYWWEAYMRDRARPRR